VASGDPDSSSVLLWKRRLPSGEKPVVKLNLEIAEDQTFTRVVATGVAPVSAAYDWTCRVLVGGLKASRVYCYRFTDSEGCGSRVGRTITAPEIDDARPVRFVFVNCQNANHGAQNATGE
jgi:alkaline phosphatase D